MTMKKKPEVGEGGPCFPHKSEMQNESEPMFFCEPHALAVILQFMADRVRFIVEPFEPFPMGICSDDTCEHDIQFAITEIPARERA